MLVVTPEGPLEATDFQVLAQAVDPYIKEKGKLNGLMIYVESFPGKNHHQNIRKVAAVTDSGFLSILPHVADHFVHADVRHFDYRDRESALDWLKSRNG